MRAIFKLFMMTAVATALQPPESYVSEPHLRGVNTDVESHVSASAAAECTITLLF
jgi:hypothetical protein